MTVKLMKNCSHWTHQIQNSELLVTFFSYLLSQLLRPRLTAIKKKDNALMFFINRIAINELTMTALVIICI